MNKKLARVLGLLLFAIMVMMFGAMGAVLSMEEPPLVVAVASFAVGLLMYPLSFAYLNYEDD